MDCTSKKMKLLSSSDTDEDLKVDVERIKEAVDYFQKFEKQGVERNVGEKSFLIANVNLNKETGIFAKTGDNLENFGKRRRDLEGRENFYSNDMLKKIELEIKNKVENEKSFERICEV